MKKILALIVVLSMIFALSAISASAEENVYSVAYLVNGNLGDKSFFDSAEGMDSVSCRKRISCCVTESSGAPEFGQCSEFSLISVPQ